MSDGVLYREDIDGLRCGVAGCSHQEHDGLYLHARCHMNAGTRVYYQAGVLTVRCRKCEALVAEIAVAGRPS
jgi:hypothetical protein